MSMRRMRDAGPGGRATPMPPRITSEEIRRAVWLLRKLPDGLAESDEEIGVLGRGNIAIYESLGYVVRSGGRLKLGPLGWEVARQLEPATRPFRTVLTESAQYQATLDWALRHGGKWLSAEEVCGYWGGHFTGTDSAAGDGEFDRQVACFFDLCQAAGLGVVENGAEGAPALLRLDREELALFLISGDGQSPVARIVGPREAAGRASAPARSADDRIIALRILSQALSEAMETGDLGIDLAGEVRRFELALLRGALRCAGGRQRRAARLLNMTKTTFNAKLKRYTSR